MGIEKFTPPPVPEANSVRPNRPNNAPVRSEMANRLAKGPEKVIWKYANPERAAMFKNLFPELEAKDAEIEDAAWWVSNFEYRDGKWGDSIYHKLMKLRILEKRAEPKQTANQPEKVSWKYANADLAVDFKKDFPDATDKEIEEGAYRVFSDHSTQFDSNLDTAWKSARFWKLVEFEILKIRRGQ